MKYRLRFSSFYDIIQVKKEVAFVSEIERIVQEVHSSMAMEGMPLTLADKDRIRKYLTDPACLDSVIQALIVKHRVPVRTRN